ncbi:DUF4365 domain-containing protein [Achromobacter insolitus]|uniref:DUF4365 domain-containing protein n=1 Tax=Achromobacter insolitus TaxID=217204 RepID=UPI00241EC535|nr:DUF4365 domain-containing protein [Achromobacter insolitus]
MDPQRQKEEFNYAYICALAARAGVRRGEFRVDDDSIDVTFQARGDFGPGRRRSPIIQFQLKCTSRDLIVEDTIRFPLSVKNYNDLRGSDFVAPRYLAVMVVPNNVEDWISHNPGHVALYHACYWVSLRDAEASGNQHTVTVPIPLAQRLTHETLHQMMERASEGESL